MPKILDTNADGNACAIESGLYTWKLTGPQRYESKDPTTGAILRYSAATGKTVEITDFGADLIEAQISAVEAMDAIGSAD